LKAALMRKHKSIPFYIVYFCLTLIIGSSLFALLWQPSFEHGVISIKIMDSYVGYNLWGFLISVLLLLAFIYFFIRTFNSSVKQKTSYVIALVAGVIFILLLDHITYGWTSYPPLSPLGIKQLTAEKYDQILLSIKGIVAIAIAFLLFRWYKQKNNAANTGLPK
jgi:hypothetical protein